MSYHNIKVTVDKSRVSQLSDFFEKHGALALTIEDAGDEPTFDVAHTSDPQWQLQVVIALFSEAQPVDDIAAALVEQFSFEESQINRQSLPDEDWERSGLDQFQPIEVTAGFWVYPSWHPPKTKSEQNIIIDPGLAFGTGSHATTYLCLKTLANIEVLGKTVLDFGCGSGILAIAALKLGASQAMAIDVDDKALACTLENAKKNDVNERISVMPAPPYKDFELPQYDLVLANILAQTLVDKKEEILAALKPSGTLILSGILDTQKQVIVDAYEDVNFEIEQKDDWLVMFGKRRDV